ncbi:Rab11 family-interacting protein 1 [Fukomys damarensis]|uniref:Rab11 family-interacting protein 1 n=1 Tax=Fukomys damarensis TaxID=885580 RepID=A0A091DY62_FUKDA|nr:Rab11 family-interacting protein 1 [Fukomys damarensis]
MSLAASAGRGLGAVWSPTHVQVTVLQARGLRAKGPGGTSDAYAVIQVGKEKYATSVSERSLGAPVWREEATFELPPLLLTVLHRALLGLDKFLGRAEVDLRELHRDQGRKKTQWYALKSKPGKKEKERGEIEVDIQFMRNNMTASMFDLSMKDKSRNPFGKLKDKIKGKHKDSASDTASAIVPSSTPSVDSDDESFSKDKKKKSKVKTLFSKSNLKKTPLSQSMSVLPISKPDKVLLRPGDFRSQWEDDDQEDESSSSASDIMSHKRTASADPKQLNQINFSLPRKEGLSFLGGLRSKNDTLSRSNVCINGSHVYVEQPEARSETKDSSPASSPSPQGFRKKHLFSSSENLAARPWKEPGEEGGLSSDIPTKDSVKSMSLLSYRPLASGDTREGTSPANSEAAKETKDSKKQEGKRSSLLSLVTGKKDAAKGSEGECTAAISGKEKEGVLSEARPPDGVLVTGSEKDAMADTSGRGHSLNPFEDVQISEPEAGPESKSDPKPPAPSVRAPQTKAVKPRLEVSSEARPKARLLSSPDSSLFLSALPSSSGQAPAPSELGHGSESQSSESPSVFSSFSAPLAAPISTSTLIGHWPPSGQGQASSEDSALLLQANLQEESLTQVPNTGSSGPRPLSKQPPTPEWKGTGSPPSEDADQTEPGSSLLEQPEVGQRVEVLLDAPSPGQGCTPSAEETPAVPSAVSLGGGRIAGPPGKLPMGGQADLESQPRPPVQCRVQGGRMPSTAKEAAAPLPVDESAPQPNASMQKEEEMSLSSAQGQKKGKKRVSFSEQLFTEEVENPTGLGEEDENRPQELTLEGAPVGTADVEPAGCPYTEEAERECITVPAPTESSSAVLSLAESSSEGLMSKPSSAKRTPLFRIEGSDAFTAQCRSKASDHEGLWSDPLSGFPSASEVTPSIVADLNLTLPSIPEVASDDERIDQAEEGGKTAVAASQDAWPPCTEQAEVPSAGTDGAVPAESLCDFRSPAPEQKAALGIDKPHLGKGTNEDEQLPGPGSDEEEKAEAGRRPGRPPGLSAHSPVPSPSLSEAFPATHSFPSSPHADAHHTSTAASSQKATAEGSTGKVENFGKRKPLLQAWVSPSETHPASAQPGAGTGAAKHRLQPVKPMNTTATKISNCSLGTATILSENVTIDTTMKKYSPSDPAFAYAQLTHEELIQLVLKQKETISKKEFQVRELEDYIDNLLVRVMEETPNILRIPAQVGKKAGKV